MKPEIKSQIKKFYIPAELGLYNKECAPFLHELEAFLDSGEKSKQKAVCFLQTGSNSDLNPQLYDQLYHDITFDDVYDKLLLVRRILFKLKRCRLMTVASSFFDCHGSVFELFLSCQHRLNFNENSSYGFDEILGDFFPCAGSFEEIISSNAAAHKKLRNQGTISAKEAVQHKLIHFSINADDHYNLTDAWLENNFGSTAGPERDSSGRKSGSAPGAEFSKLRLDQSKYNKLKVDLTTDYCFQNRSPRSFNFCENLVVNKPKSLSQSDAKALITYMSARYTLTPRFKGWFKSRLKRTQSGSSEETGSKISPVFSIYPYVPPAQPLTNALNSGQTLVFYSKSSTHLKNGIDLFTGRLEQQIGKERSLQVMKNQINWVIAEESDLLGYKVVFEANSQFLVCRNERKYRFFHTLNSKIDHDDIYAEFPYVEGEPPLPRKIKNLIKSFCTGVFETRSSFSKPIPLIVVLRSLFLQEIIRLCISSGAGIEFTLECLKVSGWRFSAEPSSWERFIRGRQAFLETSESELQSYQIPIDPDLWKIGLWKELRSRYKPKLKETPSVTFFSRHLMATTCYIVEKLQSADTGLSDDELDLLVCATLGVPDNYGTVERYRYVWGERRLSQYIKHHWGTSL
jgi:hypothetical protein